MSREEARAHWERLLNANTQSNLHLADQVEQLHVILGLLVSELQQARLARRERLRKVQGD